MYVAWGPFKLQTNSCSFRSRTTVERNRAGIPVMYRVTVQVEGDIVDNGSTALSVDQAALTAALRVNYQNLVLYNDDGSPTASALLNANSWSGVIVIDGPNFPMGKGAGPEYVAIRNFDFTVQADYVATGAGNLLIDFQETLQMSGGKPLYVVKAAVSGPNQRQLIYPKEPYRAVQQGSATGFLKYPTAPAPLFPAFLKNSPEFRKGSVERTGIHYKNYPISWTYNFESASSPLISFPNLWPLSN